MDFFWTTEKKDVMARDVLEHFTKEGKSWNQQNVATFLKNLQKIDMLRAEVRNGKYYYYPTMTVEQYALLPVKEAFHSFFGGSMERFVTAFTANLTITDEEAEELEKLIEQYNDKLQNDEDGHE